ncbi:MAG: hypothetical protein LLG02_06865 [Pelosinus sp.]|nr:hypothetical protein [Pelosinus sp.]
MTHMLSQLRIMSIETFECLVGKLELYKLLDQGLDEVRTGKVLMAEGVFKQVEMKFVNEKI